MVESKIGKIMLENESKFQKWLNEFKELTGDVVGIMQQHRSKVSDAEAYYENRPEDLDLYMTGLNDTLEKELDDLACSYYSRGILASKDIYDILDATGYRWALPEFGELIEEGDCND